VPLSVSPWSCFNCQDRDRRRERNDLRHTAVALAIAQGAHPKAIQERMGHSSITVTLDRFGHLFPSLGVTIAEGLDAMHRAAADPWQRRA